MSTPLTGSVPPDHPARRQDPNVQTASAVARGEIPGPAVPERVASLPFELFRAELIMRFDRVPDETLVDIVDTAFIPLASLPWPH